MKKRIALMCVLTLLMGVSCHFTESVAMANQNEEKTNSADKEAKKKGILQIPEKFKIIIDPFEIDGKGQIYSKEYKIGNKGETKGTLTLSNLSCKTGENSHVIVKKNPQGLHDNEEKSVYMEIVLDGKDKKVLTKKESSYKTEIKPGEELSLRFSGEVNENAAEGWKDGDIDVMVTYSWEAEDKDDDGEKEHIEDKEKQEDIEKQEEKDAEEQEEIEKENLEEPEKEDYASNANEEIQSKILELNNPGESEFVLDSWKAEDNEKFYSLQYTVKNTSESTGTLTLSELICDVEKNSGITVWTDKETLHDGQEKAVYMELILSDENAIVLSKDSQEDFEYKAKLEPGEEKTLYFVGELNGIKFEELKEGEVEVLGRYSWVLEETVSE